MLYYGWQTRVALGAREKPPSCSLGAFLFPYCRQGLTPRLVAVALNRQTICRDSVLISPWIRVNTSFSLRGIERSAKKALYHLSFSPFKRHVYPPFDECFFGNAHYFSTAHSPYFTRTNKVAHGTLVHVHNNCNVCYGKGQLVFPFGSV